MEHLDTEEQVNAAFDSLNPAEVFPVPARRELLKKLLASIQARADEILVSLTADLGRPRFESCLIELYPTVNEVKHVISKLNSWTKPTKLRTPLMLFPSTVVVDKVPLGKGCIISPFNFPLFLSVPYVAMAIGAGNAVIVRPSLKTPAFSEVLGHIIADLGAPHVAKVVSCSHATSDLLVAKPWDKIFYTGSPGIGRHIMALAAPNLVPLTLELGGKSPALVTKNCNPDLAAKRIVFGKSVNCGQICVAPDYVLIEDDETLIQAFLGKYADYVKQFYGEDPKASPDFSRIVSVDAATRLRDIIAEAEAHEGTRVLLGSSAQCAPDERYVPPTIILNPTPEMRCVREEIFGPILPVIPMGSLGDMIEYVAQRPKPLALYGFTGDSGEVEQIQANTRSGDLVFNDTILHVGISEAPFGGAGNSGMGVAHGREAFQSWCTLRTVVKRNAMGGASQVDKLFRYPPYADCHGTALGVIQAGWPFKIDEPAQPE